MLLLQTNEEKFFFKSSAAQILFLSFFLNYILLYNLSFLFTVADVYDLHLALEISRFFSFLIHQSECYFLFFQSISDYLSLNAS